MVAIENKGKKKNKTYTMTITIRRWKDKTHHRVSIKNLNKISIEVKSGNIIFG